MAQSYNVIEEKQKLIELEQQLIANQQQLIANQQQLDAMVAIQQQQNGTMTNPTPAAGW